MSGNFAKRTAFTLIEFLIALVIIGFIVAILVGVFSNPLKQASLDSQVAKAIDMTNTAVAAVQLYEARSGNRYATTAPNDSLELLVAEGYLTGLPLLDPASTIGGTMGQRQFNMANDEPGTAAKCAVPDSSWGTCWGDPDLGDDYLYTYDIKCGDFCRAFNRKLGNPEDIQLPSGVGVGIHCAYDGDPLGDYCYIMAPINVH